MTGRSSPSPSLAQQTSASDIQVLHSIPIPPPPPPPHLPTTLARPHPSRSQAPARPPPSTSHNPIGRIDKSLYTRLLRGLNVAEPTVPFEPCYLFFYGTLQDSDVLQTLLGLAQPPKLRQAWLHGFRVKMWGLYPTLVPIVTEPNAPFPAVSVPGMAWYCDSDDDFAKLEAYETSAYTWTECKVTLISEDGSNASLEWCRTFVWAGEADDKELEEGSFDLERWQKYFKASVTRKRA